MHNGWSALNGRWRTDLAPADLHSFLNPIHSVLIWWLIERMPGRLIMATLSVVQAAIIPVCYALGARLAMRVGVRLPRYILLLTAFIGFLALPNQIMLASIQNDHWGALAFLLALAVAMSPRSISDNQWSLAGVSFLLGAMAGMKPTNLVYICGFATAVILTTKTWRGGLKIAGHAAIAGGVGILLTGGYWALILWNMFGNPIFPYLSGLFPGSDLSPDHSFRDHRFLPASIIDVVLRPIAFTLNGSLIYEYNDADPRFLVLYLCAIQVVVFCCLNAWRNGEWPPGSRYLVAMSMAILVTYLVWANVFSIIRYVLALWVMAPTVSVVLISRMLKRSAWLRQTNAIALITCAALLVHTNLIERRRIPRSTWSEPYVWVERPNQIDIRGSVIVFSTRHPTAFLAPAFADAAWMTHANAPKWSESALANYRPLIEAKLEDSPLPIFFVVHVRQGSAHLDLDHMARELSMQADFATCRRLRTAFDIKTERLDYHWVLCPVRRSEK